MLLALLELAQETRELRTHQKVKDRICLGIGIAKNNLQRLASLSSAEFRLMVTVRTSACVIADELLI